MSNKNEEHDAKFYKALRNSQPLAFLASLSIIIAAFTFDKPALPNVSSHAISAAFSFIFSFVFSMIAQIISHVKDMEKTTFALQIGTYFFLGVGVLYLIFIAVVFSEQISQITEVFVAYGIGFLAIAGSFAAWYDIRKIRRKEKISLIDKITVPISGLIAVTGWITTSLLLTHAITGIEVDTKFVATIIMGGLVAFGALKMSHNIYLIIKKR